MLVTVYCWAGWIRNDVVPFWPKDYPKLICEDKSTATQNVYLTSDQMMRLSDFFDVALVKRADKQPILYLDTKGRLFRQR